MDFIADFVSDLRFAVRSTRRSMLASATIVLCLGFGIGAVGTVFAWMETLVLEPLPAVAGLSRLVTLRTTTSQGADESLSYPELKDVRDTDARAGSHAFDAIGAFNIRRFSVGMTAAADSRFDEPIWGALTTSNYFDVLGTRAIAGRGFVVDDAVVGAAPVVVISHRLWQRRFAGDREVVGRRLWLNGREMTIVGVAAPAFSGTIARLGLDVWIPLTVVGEIGGTPGVLEERDARWLSVFGRLAPGVTLESARAAMQTVGSGLANIHPENKDRGLTARPLDVGPIDRIAPVIRQNENWVATVDSPQPQPAESTRAQSDLCTHSRRRLGLPRTSRTGPREHRASPAVKRPETRDGPSSASDSRSPVLDRLGPHVAELALRARPRPARHRGSMAS